MISIIWISMMMMMMVIIDAAPTENQTKLSIKLDDHLQMMIENNIDDHHHHHRRRKRFISSDVGAMSYLQRFGYMNESEDSASSHLISENIYSQAIMEFQRFAGLNESGILDEETIQMMNAPRCGNQDLNGHGEEARRRRRRRKRYALQGSKWRRTDLTYRISQYPSKLNLKKIDIDREIARAFQVWADVTPLNFKVKQDGRVHIDIRFVSGEHGDGDPFDGPGNTLAHAYFPQYGGDAHFDNAEHWTVESYSGTNIFQVAAHELGHSLGLGHSSSRDSLMAPFYQKYKPKFKLHQDDVLAIQALYGYNDDDNNNESSTESSSSSSSTSERPIEPDPSGDGPDLCQDSSIDAVTRIADGSTYVFKGDYYWRIETNGIADGFPRRISTDWDGLPGNLNAALTWADGKTFFFKGNKYWRFKNMRMDKGYPKLINTGFAGIPDNVDAAFVWGGNGKTYFFKGNEYWRFDSKTEPPVSKLYPKSIKNWNGIPTRLDAAFRWENGMTYFFKGPLYYRFNDIDFEIDTRAKPPFPRQTSQWWFDCQSLSRKLKRRPTTKKRSSSSSSSTSNNRRNSFTDNIRSFFGISQTKPIASALMDSQLSTNESEWRLHGSAGIDDDSDLSIKSESSSNSNDDTMQDYIHP
ncbi:matrix metalloproteinase 1 isoform X2 [Dermatophagoides pteronyssinus]|uniref:matrix metalloproteinase 1 isoform X2 n=1 Tax=Dermatophagoides pteronyssinus TaxID=6956 RepID=UPI003F66D9DA